MTDKYQQAGDGLKLRLRAVLERHEGRAQAITRAELRALLDNPPDRKMRQLIRDLIGEGLPVIATTQGYFIASSYQELREGMLFIRSYLIEDARRLRDLKVLGAQYLAGQVQRRLL